MFKRSAVISYFVALQLIIVAGMVIYGSYIYNGPNPHSLNMSPILVLSIGGFLYLSVAIYRAATLPISNPCVLFRMSEPYLEIPVMLAVSGVCVVYGALLDAPLYIGGVYTLAVLTMTQHVTAHWSWIIHGTLSDDNVRRSKARPD